MAEEAPLTILFTDVEGSTDLRTQRGDKAAHEILRAHEELVRGCVAAHGGREVKALGDGFMIAFTSARRGLACAVAIQQATEEQRWRSPGAAVRVRVGLNTGEVTEEGDDLYGQAVNAAARIAARAKAGEILVAEVTRQLAGSGPEFIFRDRGRLRRKGFPERWRLYGLAWESKEGGGRQAPRDDRTPFVGREAERADLRRLLDQAVRGSGALVMVGGEPGVGKTRLAEELMTEASQRDVQVFAGHSYEMEGAAPFIAVVEILEAALAQAPSPAAFRAFLGAEAAEVARLVPKLRQLCPDIPPPLQLPAEQERRLLFNCVRDVIARTARHRPMLLVFDDLHWADDPTLLLVEHLAAGLGDLPVLMIATYRDTEVDVGRPLAKTFEDLRRRGLARWMSLARLPEEDVAQILAGLSGRQAPPELVRAIYGETEGNPFFLGEVYRYLADEGRLFDADGRFRDDVTIGELDVPASVRLVVGRRLGRLDKKTPPVLAAAALVGRAFSVEVLEAMDETDPDVLLDAVEDAERARLIVAAPDPSGEDRFIFAHELIRQSLLAEVSLTRRRRLHARVADALERHYATDLDAQAATIAHHLFEAASAGDTGRAYHHLLQAGRFAMGRAAFEEALRHYERAATMEGAATASEHAELLFELGTARRSAGHWDTAFEAWQESADTYDELGDGDGVAKVCLVASYQLAWLGRLADSAEMGRKGLAALGDRLSADRGRLLGMAGCATAWDFQYEAGTRMMEEALAVAEHLGDDPLLAHGVLMTGSSRQGYLEYRDVIEAGRRAAVLLHGGGDQWLLSTVRGFMAAGFLFQGCFDELRAHNAEFGPVAERIGNYGALLYHRRTAAQLEYFTTGDLDQLEALGQADRAFCESVGFPWVSSAWSWLGQAQFLRGNWDAALPLFEQAVRLEPPTVLAGWNSAQLFECRAYRGEKNEALAELDRWTLPEPGEPKGWGAATVLVVAVDGLTMLGERDRAAALYESVVDVFTRTGMVLPSYEDGRLYERAAGIASLAGRRWDLAEGHFRTALHQAATLPHRPEEAHTRRWYGQMLLERGGPGDRAQAEKILHQAVADYERMGMGRHSELAAVLLNAS
jgi:class 3 adenylate cyclase